MKGTVDSKARPLFVFSLLYTMSGTLIEARITSPDNFEGERTSKQHYATSFIQALCGVLVGHLKK